MPGPGEMLERGVWKAPWRGPNGEIVLLAVTSSHCLLSGCPVVVPRGCCHVTEADRLWALLDEIDPEPEYLARRREMRVV